MDSDNINFPVEFLNSLFFTGLPKHRLELKVNMPIMLLRNLNTKAGLCNGTRLLIEECRIHVLKCKIITGKRTGQIVFIPKISLDSPEES